MTFERTIPISFQTSVVSSLQRKYEKLKDGIVRVGEIMQGRVMNARTTAPVTPIIFLQTKLEQGKVLV
jgi:hypothetical protein